MKKKVLYGIIAVLTAGILTLVAGIGSSWFTNGNIGTWFNSWGKDKQGIVNPDISDKPDDDYGKVWGGVVDDSGNAMDCITPYAMPVTMAFYSNVATMAEVSELSNPSVKITASHNFEYNNILVDWSAEYLSGASASDVLTVTPDSDGSLTASISCSAPFSDQIIVKAALRDNSDVYATTTVNYIRRIDSVANIGKILKAQENNVLNSNSKTPLDMELNMGVGTVNGEVVVKSLGLCFDFFDYIGCFRALLTDGLLNKLSYPSYALGNISLKSSDSTHFVSESSVLDWRVSNFVKGYDTLSASEKQAVDYALYHAYINNGSKVNIRATYVIQVKYNGVVVQEFDRWTSSEVNTYVKWIGSVGAENLKPNLSLNTNIAL